MTPQLSAALAEVISSELQLSIMEINEMNHCHEMGLQGYKRFHRFYSMDRHRHALMISNFMVEHFHMVPNLMVTFDSRNYTATSLLEAMRNMHTKSTAHIELLKKASKMAVDENEDVLLGMLQCMLKDETWELARYTREVTELTMSNGDKGYLLLHSDKLHTKYKCKEKEYFNYDAEKGC